MAFSPCLTRKRPYHGLGARLRWPFAPACRGKGRLMDLVRVCDGLFPLPVEEKAVSWTWCAFAIAFSPCLSRKRPSHGLGVRLRWVFLVRQKKKGRRRRIREVSRRGCWDPELTFSSSGREKGPAWHGLRRPKFQQTGLARPGTAWGGLARPGTAWHGFCLSAPPLPTRFARRSFCSSHTPHLWVGGLLILLSSSLMIQGLLLIILSSLLIILSSLHRAPPK